MDWNPLRLVKLDKPIAVFENKGFSFDYNDTGRIDFSLAPFYDLITNNSSENCIFLSITHVVFS